MTFEATGYLGNKRLKKANVPVEWTEEIKQEFKKCMEDPVYFARNYIRIVHVDKGFVPFDLYPYQEDIMQKINDNRRLAVLSARQSGKTVTAVAVILHYIIFNEYKTVAILSNKGDSAKEVLSRIKLAYEALPKWLQQGIIEWNKNSIELDNNCKVVCGTTTSSTIRGASVSFLYIDECAFIDDYTDFFRSVYPTISSGEHTKLMMTSTPNGLNHYYKLCKEAEEGKNNYQFVKVTWDQVPGRDEKWKEETIDALNGDMEAFAQEYECQFLGSSGTLINSETLKSLSFENPIMEKEGLKQYKKPDPNSAYMLIADVSRGKGLDYSAFSVIDISKMPYEQVCVYRDNNIGPADYASFIYQVATMYNEAYVLVEINDIGEQVSEMLYNEFEYGEIIMTENAGRSGKRVSTGAGSSVDFGIRTTKSVKKIGTSIMKLLVEQNQILINDLDTIYEISRFSKKGVSYEAETGSTDDLVMTLVLFSWMTEQDYFKDLTDINTLMQLRERRESLIEEEMLPFGIIDNGVDEPQGVVSPGWQKVSEW